MDLDSVYPKSLCVGSAELFSKNKYHAKRRNIAWELSFRQWADVASDNCYLCGGEPLNEFRVRRVNSCRVIKYQGVDRIDNSLGYVFGNVAPCCAVCNSMKSGLTISGLKNHLLKIISFNRWV